MNSFALSYLALIFGGCLGVYQIAAAAGGFRGLRFFKNPRFNYLIGVIISSATFTWFFTRTDLHRPNREIEGAQQLSCFLLGSFLALVFTFAVSSLVNFRGVESDDGPQIDKGMDDLKTRTVFSAFAFRIRRWRSGR